MIRTESSRLIWQLKPEAHKNRPVKTNPTQKHSQTSKTGEGDKQSFSDKRRRARSSSLPPNKPRQTDPNKSRSASASPAKSRGNSKTTSTTEVNHIFRLRCAGPTVPTKMFRSFKIPGDGDCLFSSVKKMLQLDLSVRDMRARVVEYMQTARPHVRISSINEHLTREPQWNNERLYDSDGRELFLDADNLQELQSHRFRHLWTRYNNDMRLHAFAGNGEIIALSNIFSVNIFTWTISGSTAQIANPVMLEPAASARTLHLLNIDNIHFEDTDIPQTFLPSLTQLRTSTRPRRAPRASSPE